MNPPKLPAEVLRRVTEPLRQALVTLRQDLHRHPELAFEEFHTQHRLRQALLELTGREAQDVAGTGLVLRIAGRDRARPAVALRGDIDALPITEATGAPFASTVPGRMHACGHDVHASWAVGAAALLAAEPAAGDVLVVLQPAEEIGAGANAVLASGALDGVAAIFGGHVDLRFPVGAVVAQAGPLAASSDTFRLTLTGSGAHGARPHETADPVVGGAALVMALQTVVARRIDPGAPAVLTVGEFHAGTAPNIIPERVTLAGTLRATDPGTRERLHQELRRTTEGVAAAHGLAVELALSEGTPPLVNTPREAAWAAAAAADLLGSDGVRPFGLTNLGAEDFACYLERLPGCFLRIGARWPEQPIRAAHSPLFLPADEAIWVGATVLAETARRASAGVA